MMLNQPQINKLLGKISRFEQTLYNRIFEKVGEVDFSLFETSEWLTEIPQNGYMPMARGARWGGEGHYGWFSAAYTVPAALAGKRLFLMPKIGCYEGLLFVDGKAYGTFANKIQVQYTDHGNHYCDMIADRAAAGQTLKLVLELYCGHENPGNHPFSKPQITDFTYVYNGADICVKNEEIQDLYFDLLAVRQLAEVLPQGDFRRGEAVPGMNRQEVIFAYGPPPSCRTPNLRNESWLYWITPTQTVRVVFRGDTIRNIFNINKQR